jgi:oligopeptide/dipeptide ABC transporter ATP-binding protein
MRQRAMIAIALACSPKLLIADEPTTALDVTVQAQILAVLRDLRDDLGLSVLFVTHDLGVVAELCDRAIVMYAGQVVERNDVTSLFAHPRHPYTEALLNSAPRLDTPDHISLTTIPGRVPTPNAFPAGCRFNPRCRYVVDACRTQPIPLVEVDDSAARCIRSYAVGRPNL